MMQTEGGVTSNQRTLGIVGGMGAAASAALLRRIVELTPARSDQDHIEVLLHNNPHIPDRTQGILDRGSSPVPELRRSVRILNYADVDTIALACITAHHFIDTLQSDSRATIIDGITETINYCCEAFSDSTRIGILASTGTLAVGLFQKTLKGCGLQPITLDTEEQLHYFTEPIYEPWGVKAGFVNGRPTERLLEGVIRLQESGSDVIIAGCSELALVLPKVDTPVPIIDAMDCIARSAIKLCTGI